MSSDQSQDAPDGADVIILPPVLYLGAVVLGIAFHWLWPLGFARGSSLRIALGLVAICAGVAMIWSAFSIFQRIGQDPDPRTPTPAIAGDGPYRFTRNPMYVGLTLIGLGLGVALGNGWLLLLLVPTLLVMHYGVILPEERYLEGKFGDEYARFKSSVRRWI